LKGVLRTTVEFFDVTPLGRILNRFSKDTDSNDTLLPQNIMSTDLCLMSVFGVLIMSGVLMPPFIVVLVPVLVIYVRTLLRFVRLRFFSVCFFVTRCFFNVL
jgi:ATP-binding cassette subfamily C (CFTR/MRP) protein 1